jgi:hypothetical protein
MLERKKTCAQQVTKHPSLKLKSSEARIRAKHKFLCIQPLLSLCESTKVKMHSTSYGSPKELAWEIHERAWNFFSLNLSCKSQASSLRFHKRSRKKICFLDLQILALKVGGRTIKYFTSFRENKSLKAFRFQIYSSSFYYYLTPIISLCCGAL